MEHSGRLDYIQGLTYDSDKLQSINMFLNYNKLNILYKRIVSVRFMIIADQKYIS